MQYSLDKLVTGQPYQKRVVLTGLLVKGEQFKISDNAVVTARIRATVGTLAYTDWRTLTKNANREDDWDISVIDLNLPAVDTTEVPAEPSVLIDVRVVGPYVEADGTDSADTFDKTWTYIVSVSQGAA